MYLSGIADEAAQDLESQIRAHHELSWKHIEIRNVEGINLTDLGDKDFDSAARQIENSGLKVSCFASQLANWSRPIDTDFEVDVAELRRAIPRMQRLGTKFIRCMSYPNSKEPLDDNEWKKRVVERMKRLAEMAVNGGVILVHENCNGWGGKGPKESMELLRKVGSPHLKLVFDTGNPQAHEQDAWEYYCGVREEVVYVHIKDYTVNREKRRDDGGPDTSACYPGEGEGYVREIVSDLLTRGYDDGFSIEPHITSVIHRHEEAKDPELAYRTYIEYGRRLEKLIEELRR